MAVVSDDNRQNTGAMTKIATSKFTQTVLTSGKNISLPESKKDFERIVRQVECSSSNTEQNGDLHQAVECWSNLPAYVTSKLPCVATSVTPVTVVGRENEAAGNMISAETGRKSCVFTQTILTSGKFLSPPESKKEFEKIAGEIVDAANLTDVLDNALLDGNCRVERLPERPVGLVESISSLNNEVAEHLLSDRPNNDKENREFQKLIDEFLFPENNTSCCKYRVNTVKGDGNCFYRTLALYYLGNEENHMQIRRAVCEVALCENTDSGMLFSQNHYDEGNWANSKSLQLVETLIGRKLRVVDAIESILDSLVQPILLYRNNHYDLVCNIERSIEDNAVAMKLVSLDKSYSERCLRNDSDARSNYHAPMNIKEPPIAKKEMNMKKYVRKETNVSVVSRADVKYDTLLSDVPKQSRSNNNKPARKKITDFQNASVLIGTRIPCKYLSEQWALSNDQLASLKNGICGDCTGTDINGLRIIRIYGNALDLKKHCSNKHENYIPCDSFLNAELDYENYELVETQHGNVLKEKGGGYLPPRFSEQCLKIYGYNARSTQTAINKVFLENLIALQEPDFVLINEYGKSKCQLSQMKGLSMNCIVSKPDCQFSSAILFNMNYKICQGLEYMDSESFIARCFSTEDKKNNFIVVSAYMRPCEIEVDILNLVTKLIDIKHNYEAAKILVFSDLNCRRDELRKRFGDLFEEDFTIHFDNDVNAYTRTQAGTKSYLDYFITFGFRLDNLCIADGFDDSDHRKLSANLFCGRSLLIRSKMIYLNLNEDREAKRGAMLKKLLEVMNDDHPLERLTELVNRNYNAIGFKSMKRPSWVKSILELGDFTLANRKNLKLNQLIANRKRQDYSKFMERLVCLSKAHDTRALYKGLEFFTNIGAKVEPVKEIKYGTDLISDIHEINKVATEYYSKLLHKGVDKSLYLSDEEKLTQVEFSSAEVKLALEELSSDKALSWDGIPDNSLKDLLIVFDVESQKGSYKTLEKFYKMINLIANDPHPVTLGRLFLLNKDACTVPIIDETRGLNICSALQKIVELLCRPALRAISTSKSQLGFKEGMETGMNLLRLREAVHIIRKNNNGKGILLFIDLKKAYDKVNHSVLFKILEQKRLPARELITIKRLYESTRMRISPLCDIIDVDTGCIQGSTISPDLFNLYIDSLLVDLETVTKWVLAYADDLALALNCGEDLAKAVTSIESWCVSHHMEVNKKKSGIMLISHGTKIKTCHGFPLVTEYRYHGVSISASMSILVHAQTISKKVRIYSSRTNLISKKLDPMTLNDLAGALVTSRVFYGTAPFLDQPDPMLKLRYAANAVIKNFLAIKMDTSNKRLMFFTGRLQPQDLWVSHLLRLVGKYEDHFGEEVEYVESVMTRLLAEGGVETAGSGTEPRLIQSQEFTHSRELSMGQYLGIPLLPSYHQSVRSFFSRKKKEDRFVFLWIVNAGRQRDKHYEKCPLCDAPGNGREHLLRRCPFTREIVADFETEMCTEDADDFILRSIGTFRPNKEENRTRIKIVRFLVDLYTNDKLKKINPTEKVVDDT